MRFQLLHQRQRKVHQPNAANHDAHIPCLFNSLHGKAVEEVGHEPLEDPYLVGNGQLGDFGIQQWQLLPQQQPKQSTIDAGQWKPILEQPQQQRALAQRQVGHHPECFGIVIAPEHEVPDDEIDSLRVPNSGKVQRNPAETLLQPVDSLVGLEQRLFGKGPVQILGDLPEAAVGECCIDLILLFFIEIEPATKDKQLPFRRHGIGRFGSSAPPNFNLFFASRQHRPIVGFALISQSSPEALKLLLGDQLARLELLQCL